MEFIHSAKLFKWFARKRFDNFHSLHRQRRIKDKSLDE